AEGRCGCSSEVDGGGAACAVVFVFFFFFFQAEDGIRDWSVTGVQTCALPILGGSAVTGTRWPSRRPPSRASRRSSSVPSRACPRSEERRVGKEGRSRGWPYQ